MANSVCEVLLTTDPLRDAADMAAAPTSVESGAGAIVDFWGIVRNQENGREIEGIDYEAHEAMAEHQLHSIAETAAAKFGLRKVLAHHRIGFVAAGEASLWLRVSAPHRAAAFEACKWVVDELKKKVPIWKRVKFKTEAQPAAETAATTV